MLKTLLFGDDSLEGILSAFTKTIEKLDALITKHSSKIVANNAIIDTLKADSRTLGEEADKADTVKRKLQELIDA